MTQTNPASAGGARRRHGKEKAREKGETADLDQLTEETEGFVEEISDWLGEIQSTGLTNLGLDSWQRSEALKLVKELRHKFEMEIERAG